MLCFSPVNSVKHLLLNELHVSQISLSYREKLTNTILCDKPGVILRSETGDTERRTVHFSIVYGSYIQTVIKSGKSRQIIFVQHLIISTCN